MKNLFYLVFFSLLVFTACKTKTADPTETLIIASERGDCMGVAPMKCLLVKKDGHADWEYFYNDIEGFVHEPGYEYVIQVRRENVVDPPADQSNLKYILAKEVSKTKKNSQGLPDKK